jgi:hypothetical protein
MCGGGWVLGLPEMAEDGEVNLLHQMLLIGYFEVSDPW